MYARLRLWCALFLLFGLLLTAPVQPVYADLDETDEDPDAPLPFRSGPGTISLGHQVELALPDGYQFLGLPHAEAVMTQLGDSYNEDLLGIVIAGPKAGEVGASDEDGVLITLRYDPGGYVRDVGALDGEAILRAIRAAEPAHNAARQRAGSPPVHAEGWQHAPHYDRTKHVLTWGLLSSSPDDEGRTERTVHYNTRVLGRQGYVSISLATDASLIERHAPAASALLAAVSFRSGMGYEDFDAATDPVAAYALPGLVLAGVGLGAAKLAPQGGLAQLGKLLLSTVLAGKTWLALLVVMAAAAARKLWARRTDRLRRRPLFRRGSLRSAGSAAPRCSAHSRSQRCPSRLGPARATRETGHPARRSY